MSNTDYRKEIDDFEAHYKYDSTYMRELLEHSPEGYDKFYNFMPLASHRDKLDLDTYWVAKLAAMQVEDCGDCLQLNVRMAIECGVSRQIIAASIAGGNELSEKLKDVYDFATGISSNSQVDEGLEDRVGAQLDKEALLELALCIATAKVFPTIKRTLGYAKSCNLIEIEV